MNPYLIGGAVLTIAVLGFLLKGSIERNGELKAQLTHQVSETQQAVDANASNLMTISTLEVRIETMVNERRLDADRRDRILDEREEQLVVAIAEAQILREKREEAFNENPDCMDLASLSVEFFCPTVGSELRQRSTTGSSHRD